MPVSGSYRLAPSLLLEFRLSVRVGEKLGRTEADLFPLQPNESNYIFLREIAYFVMSNISGDIKLRLWLNFLPVKFARCKGNKSCPIFVSRPPARPPYIQQADLVQIYGFYWNACYI